MTPILALRPTQMAVGMQQVGVKEAKVSAKVLHQPNKKKADKWLRSRPVPVVLGPGGPSSQQPQRYLIDHHHLTFALFRQGITHCYCQQVVSDQSALGWEQFWEYMEGQHYVWPYSSDGTPLSLQEFVAHLPSDVRGLKDDPYRSLAALVRGEGGYEKVSVWVPFSEFRWANWLRSAVPLKEGEDPAQTHVVQAAVRLAGTPQAQHLPGFKAAS
ncbi:ParB/Sulfiredoxin [Haematococcus lacustris]